MHVEECFEMTHSDIARILSVESLPQVVCQGVKSTASGSFLVKWVKFVAAIDLVRFAFVLGNYSFFVVILNM